MGDDANGRSARGLPFGTRMGRYSLIRRLAVGGMAELYIARQAGIEGFEKIVALKRVLPHLAEDAQFVQMFLAEARIAATLDHPNIVHVTDIGEEDGEYFFAMEYVHGANLLEVLRRNDVLPLPRACALTIVTGVAAALHYAHDQLGPDGRPLGLVHRDVSPSNVMISYTGAVKLTDFGIVRAAGRTSVTAEGQTKGKAGYMSPEQCFGERIDRRSDVFALGILLYEATTGVRAFYAPNEFAMMGRTARVDYVPPQDIDPSYPPALARIVARALAKEPDERYPTAEAMHVELEAVAQAEGLRLSAVELSRHMKELFGAPAHPHTDLGTLPEPTATAMPAPSPPRVLLPWVLAGAGLAATVAVTIALWPRLDSAADEPAVREPMTTRSVETRPTSLAPAGSAHAEPTSDPTPGTEPTPPEAVPAQPAEAATEPASPTEPVRSTKRKKRRPRKPKTTSSSTIDRNALYPPGSQP
ncbi:serine/threonine-protein kinase [Paraliomyxa miuraensis]|uniref:serine/threonine-protein kinase n=1 Tax=Paraliomyxa miuraensis TaxID=376150 RepID=UPI0022575ECB|nr:serine/threonine-protein kinase [Paraliomyxa miuraensis]MCX4247988.1 serine/threonine protein kinase [Paraliomyxa miuraensis]